MNNYIRALCEPDGVITTSITIAVLQPSSGELIRIFYQRMVVHSHSPPIGRSLLYSFNIEVEGKVSSKHFGEEFRRSEGAVSF